MKDQKMKKFNGNYIWYLMLSLLLFACSDNYRRHLSKYQFKTENGQPDYSDLNYWAAHPMKWDPSDSIPKPFRKEKRDSLVDVFFLHPTTYTAGLNDKQLNASVDDPYLNAKTDYTSILYQASVFNQHAKDYAPRFRQAHYNNYYLNDTLESIAAFDLAYKDVRTAFEYYLKNFNHGRPVIIASHSQGTNHALRLLKDFFEDRNLQAQLVVAYVIGMPIHPDYFSSLRICEDAIQTGCFCGWRTFRKGFKPSYVKAEKQVSLVTNPVNWKTTEEYASKKLNTGSVLYKFNKVYRRTTDAQIYEGVVWVKRPKFPWSFLYATKNYHIGDINLFYKNIRENVEQRIDNYFRQLNMK